MRVINVHLLYVFLYRYTCRSCVIHHVWEINRFAVSVYRVFVESPKQRSALRSAFSMPANRVRNDYFTPGRVQRNAMSMSVCLSVFSHNSKTTRISNFCACCVRPWLWRPLAALRYAITSGFVDDHIFT